MDRFCRHCSASLTQDSRFCPSCGHDVGVPPPAAPERPDPVERFYSPPPPTRGSRLRPLLTRAAGAVVVVVAIVLGAAALTGGGENSGRVDKAFGGLTDADMERMREFGTPATAFTDQTIVMIQAETDKDMQAMAEAATAIKAAANDMDAAALEFENPDLRRDLLAYTNAAVNVGIAFQSYGAYMSDDAVAADPDYETQLGEQIDKYATAVQTAETRFYNNLADYLSPGQRKQVADVVRAHQQRVEDASE